MINQIIRVSGGSQADNPDYPGPPEITGFDPSSENGEEEEVEVPSEMMHTKEGKLMHSRLSNLWARWVFSDSVQNFFPKVLINGKTECERHSPCHVVQYKIGKETGTLKVKLSMKSSGKDCNWNGSAACTYQLWGGSKYFSSEGEHGKQKTGTCAGGANFTVTIGKDDYRIT